MKTLVWCRALVEIDLPRDITEDEAFDYLTDHDLIELTEVSSILTERDGSSMVYRTNAYPCPHCGKWVRVAKGTGYFGALAMVACATCQKKGR